MDTLIKIIHQIVAFLYSSTENIAKAEEEFNLAIKLALLALQSNQIDDETTRPSNWAEPCGK